MISSSGSVSNDTARVETPPEMSTGSVLAARRGELGLTIKQAASATRISVGHLQALEADDLGAFAAPVYSAGCLRAYARFLGLEPEPLTGTPGPAPGRVNLALDLENRHRRPRAAITGPAATAAVVVLLAGAVAGYAWRQVVADPRPGARTDVAYVNAGPFGGSSAAATVQVRPVVVGVRVTAVVWINAVVDGQPQYGETGTTLAAGSTVYFKGLDVKITSGGAAATFITIDGRDLGPLGTGVASRDFTAQT